MGETTESTGSKGFGFLSLQWPTRATSLITSTRTVNTDGMRYAKSRGCQTDILMADRQLAVSRPLDELVVAQSPQKLVKIPFNIKTRHPIFDFCCILIL